MVGGYREGIQLGLVILLQLLAATPMMRRAASSAVALPEQFERAASVFLPDQVRLLLLLAGCKMFALIPAVMLHRYLK